jgi:hypothetical protein
MDIAAFKALSLLDEDHSWYKIPIRAALLRYDAGIIGYGLAALKQV